MDQTAVIRLRVDQGNLPQATAQAAKSFEQMGQAGQASARQTANAMRQLPAQFTDIVTSLQGGQNPFTVLLQQGGQIKDSFGGVGATVRGISQAISPATVAVLGLAVALGGVAYQAYAGYEATSHLRKSLAETGNIAGLTVDAVDALSRSMAAATGTTISAARETSAALVAQGSLAKGAFEAAGTAALALSRLTGESAAEISKSFTGIADAPTAAAQKLNAQYHFLTAAQFEVIRSLEAQNQRMEAARVLLDALGSVVQQRTQPALSGLDRVVQSVKSNWSEWMDGLRQLPHVVEQAPGVIDTLIEKLKQLYAVRQSGAIAPPGFLPGTYSPVTTDPDAEAARENERLAARSRAQQAEDEKIRQLSAAHQAAMAGLARAGAQQQLAATERGLSAQSEALKLAFQRDEIGAAAYQAKLLQLDLARIDAQIGNLNRLKGAEAAKQPGNPEETLAQQAALVQLEAQRLALLQQRDKILADEASGARDVAPKARFDIADALRGVKAQDEANVKAHTDALAERYQADQDYLDQLREANERAAAEQIADEIARGEALVAIDFKYAQKRLEAQHLPDGVRDEAQRLLQQKADIDRAGVLSQGLYTDVKDALSRAFQDSHNPAKAFAEGLGNAIFTRVTARLADALATAAVGKNGQGGIFADIIGAIGGAFGGSSNYSAENGPELINGGSPPRLATGTNYVPRTMLAVLHSGEAVVPRQYNPAAGGGVGGRGLTVNVTNHIDARSDQAQVAAIADAATRNAVQAVFQELDAQGRLK